MMPLLMRRPLITPPKLLHELNLPHSALQFKLFTHFSCSTVVGILLIYCRDPPLQKAKLFSNIYGPAKKVRRRRLHVALPPILNVLHANPRLAVRLGQ